MPAIAINRDVGGSVTASDPEDTSTPDPNKKLTFTLSLPQAYSNMFDIVPSTGEIVTRSRIDSMSAPGPWKELRAPPVRAIQASHHRFEPLRLTTPRGMADNMATLPVSNQRPRHKRGRQ